MRVGIDASNLGIGGGVTHLKEILNNFNYSGFKSEISKIVVFSSRNVLNQLPNTEEIEKISFPSLNKGIIQRIIFQLFSYDKEIKKRCDILLSVSGDYIGGFKPVIGMSRNMLLYEREIWKEMKNPKEILRFWLNFKKQQRCFKNSEGIIFISNYAKNYITKKLNLAKKNIKVIHHGVSRRFIGSVKHQKDISNYSVANPFRVLYVSTVHVYKHQWNIVDAINKLRIKGIPIELNLVGSVIFSPAGKRLNDSIMNVDPNNIFIKNHGNISYKEIEKFYFNTDAIVYASTCENMPNILIESMASGSPIACSNKQPMPEFLKNGGYYFDSTSVLSISKAIEQLLYEPKNREIKAKLNIERAKQYSWTLTANQTFEFILEVYKNTRNV